jgi:hypothetical protein
LTIFSGVRVALRKYVARASYVLGVWSAAVFVLVVFNAVSARLAFGYWPHVYVDDIEDSMLYASGYFSLLGIIASGVVLPLSVLTLGARALLRLKPVLDRWIAAALLGSALVLGWWWWDPYGHVDWLMD